MSIEHRLYGVMDDGYGFMSGFCEIPKMVMAHFSVSKFSIARIYSDCSFGYICMHNIGKFSGALLFKRRSSISSNCFKMEMMAFILKLRGILFFSVSYGMDLELFLLL